MMTPRGFAALTATVATAAATPATFVVFSILGWRENEGTMIRRLPEALTYGRSAKALAGRRGQSPTRILFLGNHDQITETNDESKR